MKACKNCNENLEDKAKFCSNCGQKAIEQLKLRTLLGELANAFFAWDSKLFKTLKLLLFKPGQVSKNYIAGHRKSYVAPMRMYFFFSVVFFLFISFFGTRVSPDQNVMQDDGMFTINLENDTSSMHMDTLLIMVEHERLDELQMVKDRPAGWPRKLMKQIIKVSIQNGNFLTYLQKNISIMFFIFIPVFGWVLKLFHRKRKLDYIEHLVYGLYFHSFLFFCLFLGLAFSHLVQGAWPLVVLVAILLIYFALGLKNFYQFGWSGTISRMIFLIILYLLLFTVFASITIFLTIWLY